MEGTTIMSADNVPGRRPADDKQSVVPLSWDDENGTDADVLFLDAARDGAAAAEDGAEGHAGRPPAARPASGDDPDDDGPDDDVDHESVLVGRVVAGPAVDPPNEPRPFRPRGARDRRPVIPPELASRAAVARSLRWAAAEARYHAGFHAVRLPKYAFKTMLYAVPGAMRIVVRLVRWASAEGG
jgi:DNA segregation ATPase FtsK/SpoIIIE, S-DNA-T family